MVALLLPASGAGVAGAGGGVIAGGVGVAGAGVALESVAGGVAGASSRLLQPARRAVNMTEAKTAWRTNIDASKSCLNKNGYGRV